MTNDPQFVNLPLIATFLKHFDRPYLGPQAESTVLPNGGVAADSSLLPEGMEELIPVEVQVKMREMFVGYFFSASKTLVKGQIVCPVVFPSVWLNPGTETLGAG
jgi:regulator of nonsense transcripts 2